jgi:hypothetical protein
MNVRETGEDIASCAATIGLHGSASTFVFNVARELLLSACPDDGVMTFYADKLSNIPGAIPAGVRLVIKSHQGSDAFEDWLAARPTRLILSIRDPRDAALSMCRRFDAPLNHAVAWLRNDCARMARMMERPHLLLRYEARFFERPETVAEIAGHLGVEATDSVVDTVFGAYRTEAVRAFAASLDALPEERIFMVGKFRMHRETQILAPHIGDGRSGKWRDLPANLQQQMTAVFAPFLERFGYAP